ncbi:hypothetical protein [Rhodovulum adriaticum]|uniref:hypothetical protein n=1 Tax=Rhodovulum adriaticum TaxID=35804 RepID=UPI001050AA79|nr:hypothetical protein [Rhodovulum adriaticum]
MDLKLEIDGDLALWVGRDDQVQVTMNPQERAQCRKALLDALALLDQTIVKWSTFSTAGGMGEPETRISQRPDGCLAVFDCSPPSARPEGNPKHALRIVSSDRLSSESSERDS